MAWKIPEIKAAFDEGKARNLHSHMIVAVDSFDYTTYPIYVPRGQNPRDQVPTNGDRVMECYSYDLPWESQAEEPRANHWEFGSRETVEESSDGGH